MQRFPKHTSSCCSSVCPGCLVLSAVLPHLRSNFCLFSHYCSWSSQLLHLLGILTMRCVRSTTSWGSAFWGATLPYRCCFLSPLCVSVGFAGVVMRVGEEVSIKKAGNGSRMWESRGAMQRSGKRQWVKGSSQWGDRLALLPVQKISVFVFSGWAGSHVKNILLGAETLFYICSTWVCTVACGNFSKKRDKSTLFWKKAVSWGTVLFVTTQV